MRRCVSVLAASAIGFGLVAPTAAAVQPDPQTQRQALTEQLRNGVQFAAEDPTSQLKVTDLAAAAPDECFGTDTYEQPTQNPDGTYSCPDGSQLKVNQGYVWGMAKDADTLWFGTGPNVQCLMMAQYIMPIAIKTDSYVCEGPTSTYLSDARKAELGAELGSYLVSKGISEPGGVSALVTNTLGRIGDWRAPDLFSYDLASDSLVMLNDQLDTEGQELLNRTLGIRSAGSIDGTVIFAGPDILTAPNGAWGWVNFFVFKDGQYVGSQKVEGLTNIRKWVDVNGSLYTGVGTAPTYKDYAPDPANPVRGQVLKLNNADLPLDLEVVGALTTSPAEFTEHEGRLYASTWPVGMSPDSAGIFMSPELNGGALTAADQDAWEEVWNVKDYEPNPVLQRTMAVGPVQSYNGEIYWGTMNVPFVGMFYTLQQYINLYGEQPSAEELLLMLLGTHRATTVFRGSDFDTAAHVRLLYGNVLLPVSRFEDNDPVPPQGERVSWSLQRNSMSEVPRFGLAGFGNPFNTYTWTMAVNRGDLYVGTFDDSYLISALIRSLLGNAEPVDVLQGTAPEMAEGLRGVFDAPILQQYLETFDVGSNLPLQYGADLWRFMSNEHRAVPEFITGGDNRFSYGIRTMISDGKQLYLGMANPMNLEVQSPPMGPQGGWQLLELSPWRTVTKLYATPTDLTVGEALTLDVSVRPKVFARSVRHGTPWGILQVYADDVLLGSCQVKQSHPAECEMVTSALSAGEHTFYATFDGSRTWDDSVSKDVVVTVNAPSVGTSPPNSAPDIRAPQAGAPTIAATTMSVGARAPSKALRPTRTATLVKYAQTNAAAVAVAVQCKVKGKTLTGKAARKACGIGITKAPVITVSAKPACIGKARIRVSLRAQASGAAPVAWSRTWSVASGKCRR